MQDCARFGVSFGVAEACVLSRVEVLRIIISAFTVKSKMRNRNAKKSAIRRIPRHPRWSDISPDKSEHHPLDKITQKRALPLGQPAALDTIRWHIRHLLFPLPQCVVDWCRVARISGQVHGLDFVQRPVPKSRGESGDFLVPNLFPVEAKPGQIENV